MTITFPNQFYIGGMPSGGGSGAQIDDTTTTTTSTWSSSKIEDEITTKITEATSTMVTSNTINSMVTISQADYDLLNPPDANTFYIITSTTTTQVTQ